MRVEHFGAACISLLVASNALAAGFAVAEQGAGALGLSGASTGRLDSSDVGYFNPAALPFRTFVGSVGASLIMPSLEHEDDTVTEALPNNETPPWAHAGGGFRVGDLRLGGGATFGVPFGARLVWPTEWAGRFDVTSIELRVFEVGGSFGAGWEGPDWRVGISAGPRFLRGTVGLERKIDVVDSEGEVKLVGEANAWAAQAALAAQWRQLSLGLNWRSRATMEFGGESDFAGIPIELSGAIQDQGVRTDVTLPDRIAAGLAYDFDFGVASLDAEVFLWSTFQTFGIDFEREETPDVDEPREWNDTVAFRAGWEHRLGLGFDARGGLAWDPTPSPTHTLSPTLPDSDRVVLSLGAGYQHESGLGANIAYSRVFILETTASGEEAFPGSYRGGANILSLGLFFELDP